MPTDFQVTSLNAAYVNKEIKETFSIADIQMYDNAASGTFTTFPEEDSYTFGLPSGQWLGVGWDLYGYTTPSIYLKHDMGGWYANYHGLAWLIEGREHEPWWMMWRLVKEDLVNAWNPDSNMSVFSAQCEVITTNVIFEIYNSSFSTIADSFDAHLLNYTLSYDINLTSMAPNAWTIIGSLLTFRAPEIGWSGDMGTVMNFIIAIPIWASIAYLVYKLVTGLVPFLSGGSGD
jgi:hypothetical protein